MGVIVEGVGVIVRGGCNCGGEGEVVYVFERLLYAQH